MVTDEMIEAAKAAYAECEFLTEEQVHSSIKRIVEAAISTDAEPVKIASDGFKTSNGINRQKAADAAVKANHSFGQWMPERWLHLFLDAYEGKI